MVPVGPVFVLMTFEYVALCGWGGGCAAIVWVGGEVIVAMRAASGLVPAL